MQNNVTYSSNMFIKSGYSLDMYLYPIKLLTLIIYRETKPTTVDRDPDPNPDHAGIIIWSRTQFRDVYMHAIPKMCVFLVKNKL